MRARTLTLQVLREHFAACRLPSAAALPTLPAGGRFYSVTRTAEGLTLLVPESLAPAGAQTRRGLRALKVVDPFTLEEVGIIASLARPLADVGIALLAVSTYDSNYILVKHTELNQAIAALRSAGHTVHLTT